MLNKGYCRYVSFFKVKFILLAYVTCSMMIFTSCLYLWIYLFYFVWLIRRTVKTNYVCHNFRNAWTTWWVYRDDLVSDTFIFEENHIMFVLYYFTQIKFKNNYLNKLLYEWELLHLYYYSPKEKYKYKWNRFSIDVNSCYII